VAENAFRWGILGTAKINRTRLPGFREAGHTIAIVGSRDAARGQEHAAEMGAERFGSYEDVLSATDIDGVYISLPNALHAPWAIRAAEAGKHVLCEKPLAPTVDECKQMIAAARKNGTKLVEAFMYRNHPQWQVVWSEVNSGRLGKILLLRGAFGFVLDNPANIRLSAELKGGALQDVGVYPINFARWFLGEPKAVRGFALDRRGTGVDTHSAAVLEFADGALANLWCSLDAAGQSIEIVGDRGRLEIAGAFSAQGDMTIRVLDASGERKIVVPATNQYARDFTVFAAHVRENAPTLTPASDAIGTQAVIAAWKSGEASR
jgi:D-xylose 1-dehydrogenase (NADP+, D-xylono-1,5-lactone-forming)